MKWEFDFDEFDLMVFCAPVYLNTGIQIDLSDFDEDENFVHINENYPYASHNKNQI